MADDNARLALSGMDRAYKVEIARMAVAGVDRPGMLGIAGINTHPLQRTALGVAGNWNSNLRRDILRLPGGENKSSMGDMAALKGWERGVLFCTYFYLTCPDGPNRMRWRARFSPAFSRKRRPIPLWAESGAYPRFTGSAPNWDTEERFCQAIEVLDPDGYPCWDTVGDNKASLASYERMRARGFNPYPVWQMRESWDQRAGTIIPDPFGVLDDATRCAVANARLAAQDPLFRYYCEQSPLVFIGGLVRGPIPRHARGPYIRELCRQFPDHQFWPLGQANATVINYLGRHGLLDRIWTDSADWIHKANTDRMVLLADGLLRDYSLQGKAATFFTRYERMGAIIRAYLGAYSGLWAFPEPDPVPDDLTDPDALAELRRRLDGVQMTLMPLLPQAGGLMAEVQGEEEEAG